MYDFNAWWLQDVRVERRPPGKRSEDFRAASRTGLCPPEGMGGPGLYMAALEERGECALPEWPEALWARATEWSDVRGGIGQWLVWPDRHFNRQAAIDQ